jgi:predicted O-methyltransferase YrrM
MNHIYENIPGWTSFYDFYSDRVKQLPEDSRLVELGTYKGRSFSYLVVEAINSGKKFDIVGIDAFPWEDVEPAFIENMKPLEGHFRYFKSLSWEAARHFDDQSIDFIFIDADHVYEAVKKDIESFLPKMKPGSIMSGHDYNWQHPGVLQAVDEFFAGRISYDEKQDVWQVKI